jgi:hypothetical protein
LPNWQQKPRHSTLRATDRITAIARARCAITCCGCSHAQVLQLLRDSLSEPRLGFGKLAGQLGTDDTTVQHRREILQALLPGVSWWLEIITQDKPGKAAEAEPRVFERGLAYAAGPRHTRRGGPPPAEHQSTAVKQLLSKTSAKPAQPWTRLLMNRLV